MWNIPPEAGNCPYGDSLPHPYVPFRVNPFRVNPSPFHVEDPANGGGEGD